MSVEEQVEALAFHLRELQADIASATRGVARVRGLAADNDATRALGEIAVMIKHDLDHHAAAALDLARGIDPSGGTGARRLDDEIAAASDERWRRVDEPLLEPTNPAVTTALLGQELACLAERLDRAAAALARIDPLRPGEAIAPLEEARAELGPATDAALAAVRARTWLARAAENLESRGEREREEEMTRALVTLTHEEADRLTACVLRRRAWRHRPNHDRLLLRELPDALGPATHFVGAAIAVDALDVSGLV